MRLKKKVCFLLCAVMCLSGFDGLRFIKQAEAAVVMYSDVQKEHWAYASIEKLLELKVLSNTGGKAKFGIGGNIKRSEYISMIVAAMGFTVPDNFKSNIADNKDKTKWYYTAVEAAYANGLIPAGGLFRPNDNVTREDALAMAICGLGYSNLAERTKEADETINSRYLEMAQDFGFITDAAAVRLSPGTLIKKEEAAAIIAKMYDKANADIGELHGFYAIKAYGQMQMIESLDSVSYGWSNIELDANNKIIINNSAVPDGFEEPVAYAMDNGARANLMVSINTDSKTLAVLLDVAKRKSIVDLIVKQASSTVKGGMEAAFDGVTIDFENLRGEELKQGFNMFLKQLSAALKKNKKYLYVAVQPARKTQSYFDGYDFRSIGRLADRVIIMAHDYQAKSLSDEDRESGYTTTPVAPINEVYYALKAITDKQTGVEEPEKVLLQISFDSVQLKARDGKLISNKLDSPSYDSIYKKLTAQDLAVETYYSRNLESPYIKFENTEDGTANIVWYEDARSITAKIKLASMFGLGGISIWRIGNIPDYQDDEGKRVHFDIWSSILEFIM